MTTALDIITDAYQMLGVYGTSDTLSSGDSTLGLTTLNDMLDSWSNESLTTFATLEQSFTLVPGQQSYTIGAGGQINLTRPIRILEGPGSAYVQDSNGNNYPMEVVPRDKWNQYTNRSSLVTSDFPSVLFYDNQYPLGTINVAPFPQTAYTCFFDSYLQLVDLANLTTSISLPPGYVLAMKTNLAVALHPYFTDQPLNPIIVARAMESKGNVKRANSRIITAVFDKEIVSRSQISYNPYTDSVGSSIGGT